MDRDLASYPDISPISLSHNVFPSSETVAGSISMPFGIFVTPLISLADRRSTRDNSAVDIHHKFDNTFAVQRCQQCFGYINKYCELSSNRYYWYCSLCGFRNTFPKDRLGRYKKQTDIGFIVRQKVSNSIEFEGIPEMTDNLYDVPWSNDGNAEDGEASTASARHLVRNLEKSRGQVHILLIHESGPEDSLSMVLKAVSQAIIDLNDNILVCVVTFSPTRLGVMRLFGDVATMHYFNMFEISYPNSNYNSSSQQNPRTNSSIISHFFDFFAVACAVGDVRRGLLKGLNCILELREKEDYEYRSGNNQITKNVFKTAYTCLLEWILGEKIGTIIDKTDTVTAAGPDVASSKGDSKGGLIRGLWGGVKSTIETIRDGLLGRDEDFDDRNDVPSSSSSSSSFADAGLGGLGARKGAAAVRGAVAACPADQCSSVVINIFFASYLDDENEINSRSSSSSNAATKNGDINKLHSEWSNLMSDLIKDKTIINNIWIVNSFKSYQFNVSPFMPLITGSGGKLFRIVLGHLPQSGLRQMTEQVTRELQEQRFAIKALKLRASPGVEMNRHSVSGNLREHSELFNVYRSNSMTSESSFGCQLQWNPNSFVDYSHSPEHASNRAGIDGAVYMQLAIAYETLVEAIDNDDDNEEEEEEEEDNETDEGIVDSNSINSDPNSSSLFEDISNTFDLHEFWQQKIIGFVENYRGKRAGSGSAKGGRSSFPQGSGSRRKQNSSSGGIGATNSRKSQKNQQEISKNQKSLSALVEAAELELKSEHSVNGVSSTKDNLNAALTNLSSQLLRSRRSNSYHRNSRLVLTKRLRIITFRVDISSRVSNVIQSMNPPVVAHLIVMLSLKAENVKSIHHSIEMIRNFCIYFLSGVSFLVKREDESKIKEVLMDIENMPNFHDTVRILFGAYDLMSSMLPDHHLVALGNKKNSKNNSSSSNNNSKSSSSAYSVNDILESGNSSDFNYNYNRINISADASRKSPNNNNPNSLSPNGKGGGSFSTFPSYSSGTDSNPSPISDEFAELLRTVDLYDPSNLQVFYLPHLIPISSETLKITGRPLILTRESMVTAPGDTFLLDMGSEVILYRGVRSENLRQSQIQASSSYPNNSSRSSSSSSSSSSSMKSNSIAPSGKLNLAEADKSGPAFARNVEIYIQTKLPNSEDKSLVDAPSLFSDPKADSSSSSSLSLIESQTPHTAPSSSKPLSIVPSSSDLFKTYRDDPDWLFNDIINRISYSPVVANYSLVESGTDNAAYFASQLIEDSSRATREPFASFRDALINEAISRYFSAEK